MLALVDRKARRISEGDRGLNGSACHKRNARSYQDLFQSGDEIELRRGSRSWELVSRRDDTPALRALLADPDASFPGREQALKNGNTCTVWPVEVAGLRLVVKRYNVKGWWHGLKLRTRRGRALQSWENAHRLLRHGISTPRPVAVVKTTAIGRPPKAYLLTERVMGVGAHIWFRDDAVTGEEKREMAGRVFSLFERMRELCVTHGDMKAANIMIADGVPMLLDLDAMCWHRSAWRFRRAWKKDLERFCSNWSDSPMLQKLFTDSVRRCA